MQTGVPNSCPTFYVTLATIVYLPETKDLLCNMQYHSYFALCFVVFTALLVSIGINYIS